MNRISSCLFLATTLFLSSCCQETIFFLTSNDTVDTTPIDVTVDTTPIDVTVDTTPVDVMVDNTPVDVMVDNTPVDVMVDNTPVDVTLNPCGEWEEIRPFIEGQYNCYDKNDQIVETCDLKMREYEIFCLGWCGDWGHYMHHFVFQPLPPEQAEVFMFDSGAAANFVYCRRRVH